MRSRQHTPPTAEAARVAGVHAALCSVRVPRHLAPPVGLRPYPTQARRRSRRTRVRRRRTPAGSRRGPAAGTGVRRAAAPGKGGRRACPTVGTALVLVGLVWDCLLSRPRAPPDGTSRHGRTGGTRPLRRRDHRRHALPRMWDRTSPARPRMPDLRRPPGRSRGTLACPFRRGPLGEDLAPRFRITARRASPHGPLDRHVRAGGLRGYGIRNCR